MVDIVSDADFTPWQDYEAERLFATINDSYIISLSKLKRYARRRYKTKILASLLSTLNPKYPTKDTDLEKDPSSI